MSQFRILTAAAAPALLLFATLGSAQEAAVEASAKQALPDGRSVVDRFVEAANLAAIYKTKQSQKVMGKVSVSGMGLEGTFERYMKGDGSAYMTMDLDGMGKVRTGYDGKVGWMIHPMMGAYLQEGGELMHAKLEASYEAPFKPESMFESVETKGVGEFEGQKCYEVEVVARPLEGMDAEETKVIRTSREFYAVESGLFAGSTMTASTPMGSMEVTISAADYKKFGEALIPTKIVQKMEMANLVFTVDSVEFGQVDPAVFALPTEVEALLEEDEPAAVGATDAGAR